MSSPVCPKDHILVTIDKKFMDSTGTGLYIDPSFRPGHHATVTGKVVSVPLAASDHPQKKVILHEVKQGDDLAFSYGVVYSRNVSDNARDIFYEDPTDNAFVTRWSNQAGLNLIRRNKGGGRFDAALFRVVKDKAEIIEKVDGNKKTVNDFIDKHRVSSNDFIQYKNHLWDGERDLWMVDYQQAFMIRRGNEFIMVGGYVLLEHREVKTDEYSGKIELWGERPGVKPELRTTVVSIGTPLKNALPVSCKKGDTVIVDQRTVQQYNFWGNDYLLARQDQILCKV